jgi:hypothetical protein
MTQITGGKISFGRTVSPQQYESKRADAEFTFAVTEGGAHEEIAIKAAMLAYGKVHELLGLKTEIVANVTHIAGEKETKAAPATSAGAIAAAALTVFGTTAPAAEPEKRRGRPPKQPPVVEPDPAALEEAGEPAKTNGADPGAAPAEAWAADDEPMEITDARLLEAVTKRNGVINNGRAIKALIRTYNDDVPGSRLDQIPQTKRVGFLVELEKLQPEKSA